MNVEETPENDHRSRQQRHEHEQADQEKRETWYEKEVRRAVEHQEAQVAPAVGDGPKLGPPATDAVVDRDFADPQAGARGIDDHLTGELHTRHA